MRKTSIHIVKKKGGTKIGFDARGRQTCELEGDENRFDNTLDRLVSETVVQTGGERYG
jgi:hypothetical protein